MLYPVTAFADPSLVTTATTATYWYEGDCARSGTRLRLPRTLAAEAIARGLMRQLATDTSLHQEGKMYGVLLVRTAEGELAVLKAFSGLLRGEAIGAGWVPPIPGRAQVAAAEAETLATLTTLKQDILALHQIPERQQYEERSQAFASRLQNLAIVHRQRQEQRQKQRQAFQQTLSGRELVDALEQLNEQSRRDGIERRRLKQERDRVLYPLKQQVEQADLHLRALKQQRKHLSRQLQNQMHATYSLLNFWGTSATLHQLLPAGLPTGTGDCCAPKLLHYAATHNLQPLALAEFWWGPPPLRGDRVQGSFYGACTERCQPLMGFLLSGLSTQNLDDCPLPLLYEDDWLIAVDKPAGLLSVPGRSSDRQDSVLSRLRHRLPDGTNLLPVHRLDQDTSGILLLARDRTTHCLLSQQFQQRQVKKQYEALLSGLVQSSQGSIDLPLGADPENRPRQQVNWQQGKPSTTQFRVLDRQPHWTRLELIPITGRTHQLRVHAAHPQGLGVPILGDRLYGCGQGGDRLHLHARELHLFHPHRQEGLSLFAACPF